MCVGVKEDEKVENTDTAQNVVQGAITNTAKVVTANAVKDAAVKEDTRKEADQAVQNAVKDTVKANKDTKEEPSKSSGSIQFFFF